MSDKTPVTDPLREAVGSCPAGELLSIEWETKVSLSVIQRLMNGFGIRSDAIDTLAKYFGMSLGNRDEPGDEDESGPRFGKENQDA